MTSQQVRNMLPGTDVILSEKVALNSGNAKTAGEKKKTKIE